MDANQPTPAGYDHTAPKCQMKFTLNSDLVTRARACTYDLSATVEQLLAEFIRTAAAPVPSPDEVLRATLDTLNRYHEKHGFLSDEFPSF